ncbi:hypothetical protein HID58_055241, partial [Brassica napus]
EISDHARRIIRVSATLNYVSKPFRFFNYLAEHTNVLPMVKEGNLPPRTKQAYEELCECQNATLQDPTAANFSKAGDQNTKFFYRMVQIRNARNMIRQLVNSQEEVLTSHMDIKKEVVSHFQRFFQSQDPMLDDVSVSDLQDLLTYICTSEAAAVLAG